MAHFYGTVKGSRGEASRLGGKESGMRVTCAGWNAGITSRACYHEGKDRDLFSADFDGGSGGRDGPRISVDYFREGGESRVQPNASFLLAIPASHWRREMEMNPELAEHLRRMVFVNLDTVP